MFTALANNFGNINQKLNLFVALAPVVYLGNVEVPYIEYLSFGYKLVKKTLDSYGIYEFFGGEYVEFSDDFCKVLPEICDTNGILNVPPGPYVNDYTAMLQNLRKQSTVSVK